MVPNQGRTFAFTTGLLTGTGAESVYDTTLVLHYCINNVMYRLAAVTDGDTPQVDAVSGAAIDLVASKATVVVWAVNAAGTVSLFQGEEVANVPGTPMAWPSIDLDTYCPFAYTKVVGASTVSGTWTFGSSNWNATGITATHVNIHALPPRPISV